MRRAGIRNGDRSREALAFIRAEVTAGHRFPTCTQIAHHMGWNHSSSARDCLLRLYTWGELTYDDTKRQYLLKS